METYRKNLRDVLRRISQVGEVHEIPVQCLLIGHALLMLPLILVGLNALDEAAIFIENLLNGRCARWLWLNHAIWGTWRASLGRWRLLLLLCVYCRHFANTPKSLTAPNSTQMQKNVTQPQKPQAGNVKKATPLAVYTSFLPGVGTIAYF